MSFLKKVENTVKKPFRKVRVGWLRARIPLTKSSARYVAHRGLSAEAPENTIAAFELAAQRGFDAMETDIRRTKDGKLVLFHDDNLKRMCGVDGRVSDLTYGELAQIPIVGGNYPEKYASDPRAVQVPLLVQYLIICRQSGMVPMMELKDNWNKKEALPNDYLEEIVRQVKAVMEDRPAIFVSFNIRSLVRMREILEKENMANVTLFHLIKEIKPSRFIGYRKRGINLSFQGKSNKLRDIRAARKAGLLLIVWTIDDPDQARLYINDKVDWIASNRQLWDPYI